jgi:hypothetical protein
MPLTLSFDIGYASIGWCVLSADQPAPAEPEFLGTGVVTFPTDDCLASTRRDLRRSRRHIRSTRYRIERLKKWLLHRGVLTRPDLDKPGHPAPFLLAAAALQGHKTLNAWELWTVLRWYAHNRGYDGNSKWSREEAADDDTKKEIAARALMEKYDTGTMCETVTACLGLDPAQHHKTISSHLPYKTLDAAYPRGVVEKEVAKLISIHTGKIPGFDPETVRLILKSNDLTPAERDLLTTADIRLPKRHHGGLLFGQLIPRFDNRIISRCPITWAEVYDNEITAGKTEAQARKQAEKFAKVPTAKSKEFLEYRFARILANIKANGEPLDKELRATLFQLAEKQGRLTHKDLEREIKSHCGPVPTNIDAYFKIHPDSEEALVLDPVMDEVRKAENSPTARLYPFWKHLTESIRGEIIQLWLAGKSASLAFILQKSGDNPELLSALEKSFATLKPKKGQLPFRDFDTYLIQTKVAPKIPSGRAPYARPILRQVRDEVLAGYDPTKPAKSPAHPEGEEKAADGILYSLLDPNSRTRELQNDRPLDKLTNNHLVRHRLLILDRLLDDILAEFCTRETTIPRVIVEVGRDLKEFSGKTAKQITAELNSRLRDFKSAVKYLEENASHLPLTGSLIRKCRIAMDLDWQCPFTGEKYDAADLPSLEREHIIPYATRNTNALHALVLTWPEVNRWKNKRTARQFIIDEEGKTVPGLTRLCLFTLRQYDAFVTALDTKGHFDDYKRKTNRKALLATTALDDKDLGFTDGMMTQTSHLMKLAMRSIKNRLPDTTCDTIPGAVTAEVRKSWNLLGTLAYACPEIIDPANHLPRPKDEIRGLTHLHHALDAATLALISHYFPFTRHGENQSGKLWAAMTKRNRKPEEQTILLQTGRYKSRPARPSADGSRSTGKTELQMVDLDPSLKQKLSLSLSECRVMQHVPADRSGTKAELTTWGITKTEGEGENTRVTLHQQTTTVDNGKRLITVKTREERAGKLLGPHPKNDTGKLADIKGAMIIGENYGLALDPTPTVIPFHDVSARLKELQHQNRNKPIRVLRNGMLIRLKTNPARSQQDYTGIWRIASIKNNKGKFLIDMIRPSYITPQNGVAWSGMNKTLGPLLECGLEILPQVYSGHSVR